MRRRQVLAAVAGGIAVPSAGCAVLGDDSRAPTERGVRVRSVRCDDDPDHDGEIVFFPDQSRLVAVGTLAATDRYTDLVMAVPTPSPDSRDEGATVRIHPAGEPKDCDAGSAAIGYVATATFEDGELPRSAELVHYESPNADVAYQGHFERANATATPTQ